ncbi:MAG: beta-N-acetylhexosaminidase [Burkholderiales bacterium]|jgi:beta-N-acetylhexosaminidase|nr:beta-N-acetylhexosaminidase [Burkholderiales bacterium]
MNEMEEPLAVEPRILERGVIICGVESVDLDEDDRRRLLHPLVGGAILFARNYEDRAQLTSLCREIHALRSPKLLIGVDQEGGRIQRLREGFTEIPPMRSLQTAFLHSPAKAENETQQLGALIGKELREVGIDFTFAPVLDLDYGSSAVIGDRSFGSEPETVARLAAALHRGLRSAGCAAVGKHFPGHGFVSADSHIEVPKDTRTWAAIQSDIMPYRAMIANGLESIMMAHVIYPEMDMQPAGYSSFWIRETLRKRLGFRGLIFSDDLGMFGAQIVGDWVARAEAATQAGCDVVLACNEFGAIDDLLARWQPNFSGNHLFELKMRWQKMTPRRMHD